MALRSWSKLTPKCLVQYLTSSVCRGDLVFGRGRLWSSVRHAYPLDGQPSIRRGPTSPHYIWLIFPGRGRAAEQDHGSDLNEQMVEIEIGVLAAQCLDRRIDIIEQLTAETTAWKQQRNAAGARIKWISQPKRPALAKEPCIAGLPQDQWRYHDQPYERWVIALSPTCLRTEPDRRGRRKRRGMARCPRRSQQARSATARVPHRRRRARA